MNVQAFYDKQSQQWSVMDVLNTAEGQPARVGTWEEAMRDPLFVADMEAFLELSALSLWDGLGDEPEPPAVLGPEGGA